MVVKEIFNLYRKGFKNNGGLSDEESRVKIIRNLCVAAYRSSLQKNPEYYFCGKMRFVIKDGVLQKKKAKWIRPNLLDEIAERLITEEVVAQ